MMAAAAFCTMTRRPAPAIVTAMLGLRRVEGYAIVSSDGMIADASGEMPDSIRNAADQKFLQAGLDRAAIVVHGRHSHEGGARAARRKRIVLTRKIAAIAPDPAHPSTLLWNPTGATLERAIAALEAPDGAIAIIGGTEVFSLFLPLYDAFHLSCAARAKIPGGRPVFEQVGPNDTPDEVLALHGLVSGPRQDLDAAAGVAVVTWKRQS
jgi:dihydrofolate reductase